MAEPASSTPDRVLVIGAGPIGLVTALCLAQAGVPTTVVERRARLEPFGSRAVATERTALEVLCRLGCGQEILDRGVTWTLGRTYLGHRELFQIRFPEVGRDALPPFVNIPQYETEQILFKAAAGSGLIDFHWSHEAREVRDEGSRVTVTAEGPGGPVELSGAYLVACDGARSTVRSLLGLELEGSTYEAGKFLIADIRAKLPFERERRFWFDPPGLPGIKVLIMHPQPDDVWRIDGQVEDDIDIDEDRRSGRLDRRIRSVIGDADYEIVWLSVWTFHERMLRRFRHGRIFFAGDSAHLVAPFGARGMNSGIHDAENLAWKLALVLRGVAPDSLLDTYDHERVAAAAENVRITDRTMQFLVPTTRWGRLRRRLILRGALRSAALRQRVDSGKLYGPHVYTDSPIVSPARERPSTGAGEPPPLAMGQLAPDGPCTTAESGITRLREAFGSAFIVLVFGTVGRTALSALEERAQSHPVPARVWNVLPSSGPSTSTMHDTSGTLTKTYAQGADRQVYVVRPDGHIASIGPLPTSTELDRLLDLASGRG